MASLATASKAKKNLRSGAVENVLGTIQIGSKRLRTLLLTTLIVGLPVCTISSRSYALEMAAPCDIKGCEGGGAGGVPGPGPGDLGGSTMPSGGDNRKFPRQDKEADKIEYDTDRVGSDYRNFDLTRADPALCQTSCSGKVQCKAWTYVKPGIQGLKARCWLKTSVPTAKHNACCVSGLK